MRRGIGLLSVLLPLALGLGGCVEVEEELALDSRGGGVYELRITWDQVLLEKLVAAAGPEAANRFRGRDLPLEVEAWRDSLRDLEGLQVRHTQVRELEDGRRRLRVRVSFGKLEDLLRWEMFARRSIRVSRPEAHRAVLEMDPLARVPYLDPLARALRRVGAETDDPEDRGVLDPSPRERLGLSSRAAREGRALLEPALASVSLTFRVRTPGLVNEVGAHGEAYGREKAEARFVFDFETLGAASNRAMRLVWRPNARDRVPTLEHPGDRSAGPVADGAVR